jgi:hypothetical protein
VNLPNCQNAYIPDAKLSIYLLNHAHPQNKGKAQFFNLAGYDLSNVEDLRMALLELACMGVVVTEQFNEDGVKYVVIGKITGANGKQYELKTVWVVEPPEDYPRLVTAYPN